MKKEFKVLNLVINGIPSILLEEIKQGRKDEF